MVTLPALSHSALFCFAEAQWGHSNNSNGQAPESSALCGILPARRYPADGSRPLPLCHSVPQGLWGLKLCRTCRQRYTLSFPPSVFSPGLSHPSVSFTHTSIISVPAVIIIAYFLLFVTLVNSCHVSKMN